MPSLVTDGSDGVEVVKTRAGESAVLDRATGEVMHPVIGPRAEADALYVRASRLAERLLATSDHAEPLTLLDVGLGAGSNAIAAWRVAESIHAEWMQSSTLASAAAHLQPPPPRRLSIVSFDRTLAAMKLALRDEHAEAFGFEGAAGVAALSLVTTGHHANQHSEWRMVEGELPATLGREAPEFADVVFWDPFSPRANPELWNMGAFSELRRLCRSGATVHTYSCATAVRSALLLAGFSVGIGEGTGSKEGTTLARVGEAQALARPLDKRWLERLARSSAPFPGDAPSDALERIRALPQFG